MRYQIFALEISYRHIYIIIYLTSYAKVLETTFCVENASVQLSIFVFDEVNLFIQLGCLFSRRLTWLMRLFTWIEAQTVLEDQYSRLLMSFYITAHALSGWKKDKQRGLTKYWTFFTITYVWKILHCCSLFKLLYTSFENVVYFFVMQNFKFSNCSLQQWLQTLRLYIIKCHEDAFF